MFNLNRGNSCAELWTKSGDFEWVVFYEVFVMSKSWDVCIWQSINAGGYKRASSIGDKTQIVLNKGRGVFFAVAITPEYDPSQEVRT